MCPELHSQKRMAFKLDPPETLVPLCGFPESATLPWPCPKRLHLAKTRVSGLSMLNGAERLTHFFCSPHAAFLPGNFCSSFISTSSFILLRVLSLHCLTEHAGHKSHSSVGIATRWTVGIQSPLRAGDSSVPHSVQTGSGAHSLLPNG